MVGILNECVIASTIMNKILFMSEGNISIMIGKMGRQVYC